MSAENKSSLGADAVDAAIAQGLDLDGTPIPAAKLELYNEVMGFEAGRQRSGVSNTVRSLLELLDPGGRFVRRSHDLRSLRRSPGWQLLGLLP